MARRARASGPSATARCSPPALRETLAVGLKRADAIVLMLPADIDCPIPELLAAFGDKPVLVARGSCPPSRRRPALSSASRAWPSPGRWSAGLKAAGCDLADFGSYPDQAAFSEATLKFLQDRAEVFGAGLVTTEKDWVRLPPEWRAKVTAWPVRARFDDEAALDALLVWSAI